MGFADLLTKTLTWTLVSQDDGTEIEGDFPAGEVVENIAGAWAEQSTIGLDQPVLQFVGGVLDTLSIEVRVFAKHRGALGTGIGADDIGDKVAQIRELARRDPDLGRPHVWLFAIGTQLSQRVVVRSVSPIKYDRFRDDGTIRGIVCTFDMARYEPYSVSGLAEAESLVTPARTGETYEHVAARVHNDPLLGEALRRRNPDRRVLVEGDLVHVPTARILRREITPLVPQSIPLKAGEAQRANIVEAFRDRGQPTTSFVLLEDW